MLASLAVLPMDGPVDQHYGEIRAALERAGTAIGSHDLFFAAHARACGLTPVTHKLREFQRVPGLRVKDWLAPPAWKHPADTDAGMVPKMPRPFGLAQPEARRLQKSAPPCA